MTYKVNALISAPKIDTDLLWSLSALFVLLAFIYFVSVFYFRNKISSKSRKVKEKKKELSPIISEFLFYDEAGDKKEKLNYIDLKIQIRELIKDEFDRKVLTEVLMDLRKDVSGNTRDELFHIYQDLELHKDAYKKLKSWRWEVVSKGIFELTQMNVVESYGLITKFINDKRPTIRKQSELAAVTLKKEGISYFLDHTKFKISEWQQLKLLDVIRNKVDFLPPPFRLWLTSKNNYVVLFALRLINHYNQNDASSSLIALVKHKNNHIRKEAIHCIQEFNIIDALPTMKTVFRKCNIDVKMYILDTIAQIGGPSDIDFLKRIQENESVFTIRSKAISALNTISPESILPSKDVEAVEEWELTENQEKKTEPRILQNEAMQEPKNKEEENKALGDIKVVSEIISGHLEREEIAYEELGLNEMDVSFLPLVKEEELTDSNTPLTEEVKREVATRDIKDIQIIFEEVKFEVSEPDVAIDFLPVSVDNDSILSETTRDLNLVYEEVFNETFETVNFDELGLKESQNREVERFVPQDLPEIETSLLLKIEVAFEEVVFSDTLQKEEPLDIDWTIAFTENSLPEESLSLATISTPDIPVPISSTVTNPIPRAKFYQDEILETMVLLENISELGDHREIPFLKFLLEKESSADVQDRINSLIQRFADNHTGIEYFKVTHFDAGDSVFNELMEKSDLESKLILLKEIVAVGDEKEMPLLNSMINSDDEIIRKKAKSGLKKLTKRLAIEANNVDEGQSINQDSEPTDLFKIDFEMQKSKPSARSGSTALDNNMDIGSTLFDHICAVSTKLYDKFNG